MILAFVVGAGQIGGFVASCSREAALLRRRPGKIGSPQELHPGATRARMALELTKRPLMARAADDN